MVGELWLIFGIGNPLEDFYSVILAAELRVYGGKQRPNRETSKEAVGGSRVEIVKVVRRGWILNTFHT